MKDLNRTEMKLLQYLGKTPEKTNKELARLLELKNSSYVSTLKEVLKRKQYFHGPYYQTDYGRIFKNRVRKAIAIVLFEQSYPFLVSLLENIHCFSYLYPIEERFFKSYMAGIFDSDTQAVKKLFDYLEKEGVIFHYELYLQDYQTHVIPPTFLADSCEATFVPPLDNLLEGTAIPDLSFGGYKDITLSVPEQLLVSSFEMGIDVLTQIMEKETERGNFFTYAEWKYARKRLADYQIIQQVCDVFPFPHSECSHFFLFLCTDSILETERILFNFGKGSRLFKKIFLWTSHENRKVYGVIYCLSHPEFTIKLLRQLDMYEEIEDKKFFVLRRPFSLWRGQSIKMEGYNTATGTLHYPYETYLEQVKTFVEENPW